MSAASIAPERDWPKKAYLQYYNIANTLPATMKSPTGKPSPNGRHSPYHALNPASSDEHPVDALVERRAPQRRLRRDIRHASRQLARALAARRGLWLDLEQRLAEYRLVREQAYFDVGFEHGFAAGQAQLVRLLLAAGARVEQLAERVRTQALLDDRLSPQHRALALLQAAYAVGFGRDEASETHWRDGS